MWGEQHTPAGKRVARGGQEKTWTCWLEAGHRATSRHSLGSGAAGGTIFPGSPEKGSSPVPLEETVPWERGRQWLSGEVAGYVVTL